MLSPMTNVFSVEHTAPTRLADLDTQRHVNSRIYEDLCLEARAALLQQHGFSFSRILEEDIFIQPVHSFIQFKSQQMQGTNLTCRVEAVASPGGKIDWDQRVFGPDGKEAAHIQMRTLTYKDKVPLDLLPTQGQNKKQKSSSTNSQPSSGDQQGSPKAKGISWQYQDVPEFSGNCQRLPFYQRACYSDRNVQWSYNPSGLWRILEEARWEVGMRAGLTPEAVQEMDTTLFWMGGHQRFFLVPEAGRDLLLLMWVYKVEKIRCYLRFDVLDALTKKPVISALEENLIVSLSKARPRRAPERFLNQINEIMEFPPA